MEKIITIKNANFSAVSVDSVNVEKNVALQIQEELSSTLLLYPATTNKKNPATGQDDGKYLSNRPATTANRASVVIPISNAIEISPLSANDFKKQYTHLCIPTDYVSKIKVSLTNNGYYLGLVVMWSLNEEWYDSGWVQGGNYTEFDIATYFQSHGMDIPKKIWIASTLKKGSAGTTAFVNETLQSLGVSIELTYKTPDHLFHTSELSI